MPNIPPGIFAHHCHVFPAGVNADGTPEALLRHLDATGIEKAVCFAPFSHQLAGKMDVDANDWLSAELKHHPRLRGFGTLDFTRDDVAAQIEHIADLGFPGIKIHPPGQKLNILSDIARKAYEAAERLDLFLTFHTGVHHSRMSESRVVDWDEIAFRFPKLRFSMEHIGGWSFFHEAMAVIVNNTPPPWEAGKCNVFAGLTSIFSPDTLSFWHQPPERLRELAKQTSPRQMIFGLDFPYNDVAATLRGIETIQSLGLSAQDTALILGGNLKRELRIAD